MKLDLSFPLLVIEQNRLFHCAIKELSILESGEDLVTTYQKALQKKEEVLRQIREAHLDGILLQPLPTVQVQKKSLGSYLNILLVACFCMVPLAAVTLPAGRILNRVCRIFDQPIDLMIDFRKRLEQLPIEKQEELKKSIRFLVAQFEAEPEERL